MSIITKKEFRVLDKRNKDVLISEYLADVVKNNISPNPIVVAKKLGLNEKNGPRTIRNWFKCKDDRTTISEKNINLIIDYCIEHDINISDIEELNEIRLGMYKSNPTDKYRQPYIPSGGYKTLSGEFVLWKDAPDINTTLYDMIKDRLPKGVFACYETDFIIPTPEVLDVMQMEYAYPDKNLVDVYEKEAGVSKGNAITIIQAYKKFCTENERLGFGKEYWLKLLQQWNADLTVAPDLSWHNYLLKEVVKKIMETLLKQETEETNSFASLQFDEFIAENAQRFKFAGKNVFIKIGDVYSSHNKTTTTVNGFYKNGSILTSYISRYFDIIEIPKYKDGKLVSIKDAISNYQESCIYYNDKNEKKWLSHIKCIDLIIEYSETIEKSVNDKIKKYRQDYSQLYTLDIDGIRPGELRMTEHELPELPNFDYEDEDDKNEECECELNNIETSSKSIIQRLISMFKEKFILNNETIFDNNDSYEDNEDESDEDFYDDDCYIFARPSKYFNTLLEWYLKYPTHGDGIII